MDLSLRLRVDVCENNLYKENENLAKGKLREETKYRDRNTYMTTVTFLFLNIGPHFSFRTRPTFLGRNDLWTCYFPFEILFMR
jgi:hypothetical protein